jgi:hypothetical protein
MWYLDEDRKLDTTMFLCTKFSGHKRIESSPLFRKERKVNEMTFVKKIVQKVNELIKLEV